MSVENMHILAVYKACISFVALFVSKIKYMTDES